MMETASAMRSYTSEQIKPLLKMAQAINRSGPLKKKKVY